MVFKFIKTATMADPKTNLEGASTPAAKGIATTF